MTTTKMAGSENRACLGKISLKMEQIMTRKGIWKQMTETEEQKADAARGDRVKQAKEHWLEFGDVPMNPETECIEAPFLHFPAGTHREEIWNWFEEYYRVPVYDLLYDFDNVK